MSSRSGLAFIKSRLAGTDWQLLIFLTLFINVKLAAKLAAIILVYLWRPDSRFGLSFTNSRLPLFYVAAAVIALVNYFLLGGFTSLNYSVTVLTGLLFWLLCLLAMHQVKLSVERNDAAVIHRTLLVFFCINALVSLATYAGIVMETGALNPYKYQGNYQKYFIGTGDYIKGISFDTSTTNAVLNSFAVLYCLLRNRFEWCLFFMCMLLLTGSNITNMLLCAVLLLLLFYRTSKAQKTIIGCCFALLLVFLVKVSPQNNGYISAAYERVVKGKNDAPVAAVKEIPLMEKPASTLSEEEKKQKIAIRYIDSLYVRHTAGNNEASSAGNGLKTKPVLPQPNIHSAPYQHKDDMTSFQKSLVQFSEHEKIPLNTPGTLPGKAVAMMEVFSLFRQHPLQLLTGTGMANFSSKLAFKVSCLKIAGGFPRRFQYIHPGFEKNHLALYIRYFTKSAGLHSLINKPDSVYAQLLSEYGLAGLAALFTFYWWFFARHYKRLSWGLPLIVFTMGLLFLEYWFEQLSVMTVFELLLFLNIKETAQPE
ncbi:MAG: hypothetical protein U0V75_00420 [Ferruginibacter sp.]